MRRFVHLPLALALAVPATALAQVPATLLLTNGNRVSGELVDMGGSGFTVTENGQQRTIPTGEVAVIDFVGGGQGLPETETSQVPASGGLVILRNGQSFGGSLYDISGTSPLRITFDTPNGRRDVNSGEVTRIYVNRLSSWTSATAAQPAAAASSGAVTTTSVAGHVAVMANQQWTPTGITVRAGQMVTFTSSGQIQLSTDPNDVAVPAGSKTARRAAAAPMPGALAGALIGRVGNAPPFGIGDQTVPLRMPAAGQLFLGINDDNVGDNVGQFNVQVTPGAVSR